MARQTHPAKSMKSILLRALLIATCGVMLASAQTAPSSRLGFEFSPTIATPPAKLSVTDLNSNGAIVMPKFQVESVPITIPERELLTPSGRAQYAREHYTTALYRKTFGPLGAIAGLAMNPLGGWRPNDNEALMLYEQDERLRRLHETDDLLRIVKLTDPKQAAELREAARSHFLQQMHYLPLYVEHADN
jgi:hypothetical protein